MRHVSQYHRKSGVETLNNAMIIECLKRVQIREINKPSKEDNKPKMWGTTER